MQEKKSQERKVKIPLEETATTREVMDSNRARVLYPRDELKPLRVIYSDGATAEFKYDIADNTLLEISERNGIIWSRVTTPDEQGFCQWRSSDGQDCHIRFSVLPDGTYQRQDPSGVIETVTTGFKRFVARPFPSGFDPVKTLSVLFAEIDKNRDRTLTRTELEAALSDLCANRDNVRLIAMLKHYFDDIIRTRDDPMLIESGGLTVEDLARFERQKILEQKKLAEPPIHFAPFFDELFASIDTDKDGMTCLDEIEQICKVMDPHLARAGFSVDAFLTAATPAPLAGRDLFQEHLARLNSQAPSSEYEVNLNVAETVQEIQVASALAADTAVSTQTNPEASKLAPAPPTTPQQRTLTYSLAGILYNFTTNNGDLSQFDIHDRNDWVYKKNFMQICEQACLNHTHSLMIRGGWYYDEQKSAALIPRNVFADPVNPGDSVRVEAVRQGSLGDPVFLATLAGTVAANPPSILKSVKQNAGKTCTITFPGAPSSPLTMSWLTALELSLFQHGTEHGIWCAFMQKAYETHLALHGLKRSSVPDGSDESMTATNGPFELLASRKAGWQLFRNTGEEEVREIIQRHQQGRLPVLVCTAPLESWIGGIRIHPSHVMALVRLNKETGQAILRDPLASAARRSPGAEQSDASILTVTVEQLLKHFLAISILR